MPLCDPAELRDEMTAAGFGQVEVHTAVHEMKAASVDEFWNANLEASAPLAAMRAGVGEPKFAEISNGVLRRLRARMGGGPVVSAWPARRLGVGLRI